MQNAKLRCLLLANRNRRQADGFGLVLGAQTGLLAGVGAEGQFV
jgi:hypothetical protein